MRDDEVSEIVGRLETWLQSPGQLSQSYPQVFGAERRAQLFGVFEEGELLSHAAVRPLCNQIELHPLCQQRALSSFCRARGIDLVAYSPLGVGALLEHPVVTAVAAECGATPAQTLLRWSLDHGHSAIPRSARAEHVLENAAAADAPPLAPEQLERIDRLDEDRHYCWDSRQVR